MKNFVIPFTNRYLYCIGSKSFRGMKIKKITLLLSAMIFIAPMVTAQGITSESENTEDLPASAARQFEPPRKTRYFISTNLVNLTMLYTNVALEMRFTDIFSFKTSVYGGFIPYPFSDWSNGRMGIIGLRPEARWYVNRSRSLYVGVSGTALKVTYYDREWSNDRRDYVKNGRWIKEGNDFIFNAGIVLGYYLQVGKRFGVDFNAGFGPYFIVEWVVLSPIPTQLNNIAFVGTRKEMKNDGLMV